MKEKISPALEERILSLTDLDLQSFSTGLRGMLIRDVMSNFKYGLPSDYVQFLGVLDHFFALLDAMTAEEKEVESEQSA